MTFDGRVSIIKMIRDELHYTNLDTNHLNLSIGNSIQKQTYKTTNTNELNEILGRLDDVINQVENFKANVDAKNKDWKTAVYLASAQGKLNY